MADLRNELIQLEYKSLRDEILQNKSYVFERPLLILTAVALALSKITEKEYTQLLFFTLVFMLLLNLWFTANRLSSGARISAYLDIMIEGNEYIWIGWEKSLRFYRIWLKKYPSAQREIMIRDKINKSAIPDAMMFYPPIYWFHVIIILISFTASGYLAGILVIGAKDITFNFSLLNYPWDINVICFVSTLLITTIFVYSAVIHYNPIRMRSLMERNRAIWVLVFDENKLNQKQDNGQENIDGLDSGNDLRPAYVSSDASQGGLAA